MEKDLPCILINEDMKNNKGGNDLRFRLLF